MAYETMESASPCPCGNGKVIAEWQEHDVYPSSNPYRHWRFECSQCASRYVFYEHMGEYMVRKTDADEHRAMLADYGSACRKTNQIAEKRYEQRWLAHFLHLPNKRVMHRVLGVGRCSYGTFLKRSNSQEWLVAEAKGKFSSNLNACLNLLGVKDAEVNQLIAAADKMEKAADAFWNSIEKIHLPLCC